MTDLAGGTNFVIINLVTWSLSALPHPYYRQQAATWLVVCWGLRLSGYLFYRILKIGDDNRFDGLRDRSGSVLRQLRTARCSLEYLSRLLCCCCRPCQFLGFWIFQMVWVWVVSLPVTFVNSDESSAIPHVVTGQFAFAAVDVLVTFISGIIFFVVAGADVIGTLMAIAGLLIEAFADQQKFSFKYNKYNVYLRCSSLSVTSCLSCRQDAANKTTWCRSGLWYYSRHPNYFGKSGRAMHYTMSYVMSSSYVESTMALRRCLKLWVCQASCCFGGASSCCARRQSNTRPGPISRS